MLSTKEILDMSNPIVIAVMPLKEEAVQRAAIEAQKIVDKVRAELEANGMDMSKAAPRPDSFTTARPQYLSAMAKVDLFSKLTRKVDEKGYETYVSRNQPRIVVMSDTAIAKFIEQSMYDAGFDYDAFVCKLTRKIGGVTNAVLAGNHVWGFSVLSVTLADGTVQNWKTQQIVNMSKFTKLFNQWPTRLIKGGK